MEVRGLAIHHAVGIHRWCAATHADRLELNHFIRDGHQRPHRAKRATPKIKIKPRKDHRPSLIRQPRHEVHQFIIKKLGFFDENCLGTRLDKPRHVLNTLHGNAGVFGPEVGNDIRFVVSIVYFWLKNLNSSFGVKLPARTTDQLLRLSSEHRSADDNNTTTRFHPAILGEVIVPCVVHLH